MNSLRMLLTAVMTAAVFTFGGCREQPIPETAEAGTPATETAVTEAAVTAPEEAQWISLFNGKSLEGWVPKFAGYALGENFNNTFRVEDGVIRVSYDQYERFDGQFGHLFYKAPFSHYRLRLEYRFVGEQVPGGEGWALRNSGVMYHCQAPETMGRDQNFPVSLEGQFLGGDGEHERTTGNLCTPGTNVMIDGKLVTDHCLTSKSQTYHGDQWVKAEFEVHGGGLVRHWINGEVVFEYTQPQLDPRDADARKLIEGRPELVIDSGYIALQAESHPLEFRNIEVMILDE